MPQAQSPPTDVSHWRQRFMAAGKTSLAHAGKKDPAAILKKERDNFKMIIGELVIANDVLKKP